MTIPYSVTSIGKYAFDKCIHLVNVYYGSIEDNKLLKQIDFDFSGVVDAADVSILAQHLNK